MPCSNTNVAHPAARPDGDQITAFEILSSRHRVRVTQRCLSEYKTCFASGQKKPAEFVAAQTASALQLIKPVAVATKSEKPQHNSQTPAALPGAIVPSAWPRFQSARFYAVVKAAANQRCSRSAASGKKGRKNLSSVKFSRGISSARTPTACDTGGLRRARDPPSRMSAVFPCARL